MINTLVHMTQISCNQITTEKYMYVYNAGKVNRICFAVTTKLGDVMKRSFLVGQFC